MTVYRVYYMKPEHFASGILGQKTPTLDNLLETHVFLREVEANDLEDCFVKSQGEVWSPNGEARSLILGKGLRHTSMSVGDVACADGKGWVVAMFGFDALS